MIMVLIPLAFFTYVVFPGFFITFYLFVVFVLCFDYWLVFVQFIGALLVVELSVVLFGFQGSSI